MANPLKFSALGTFTTAIAGAASGISLKNLANGGRKLGAAIDLTGASNRQIWSNWELLVDPASAPGNGAPVELYFICAPDGTNYEYGDDSTDPPFSAWAATFYLQGTANQHRIDVKHIRLPNCIFKPLVRNNSGQAFANINDVNILSYESFTLDYP